jgi:hypothetical protein
MPGLLSMRLFFILPLIVCLLMPVPLTTGCKTSRQEIAYRTLASIELTVDRSMTAYSDQVVAGKVDQATQDKVKDVYGRYQAAFSAAVAAAKLNFNTQAPSDVATLADSLTSIIQSITRK